MPSCRPASPRKATARVPRGGAASQLVGCGREPPEPASLQPEVASAGFQPRQQFSSVGRITVKSNPFLLRGDAEVGGAQGRVTLGGSSRWPRLSPSPPSIRKAQGQVQLAGCASRGSPHRSTGKVLIKQRRGFTDRSGSGEGHAGVQTLAGPTQPCCVHLTR